MPMNRAVLLLVLLAAAVPLAAADAQKPDYSADALLRFSRDFVLRPTSTVGDFDLGSLGAINVYKYGVRGTFKYLPFLLSGMRVTILVSLLSMIVGALWSARDWPVDAKLVPNAATIAALVFAALNLATEVFAPGKTAEGDAPALEQARAGLGIALPHAPDLAPPLVRARALRYFAWLAGLYAAAVLIGFVPAIAVFVMLIMRVEFAERWPVALVAAAAATAFLWGIFDRLLAVPWPPSLLGDALPWLREATGLV